MNKFEQVWRKGPKMNTFEWVGGWGKGGYPKVNKSMCGEPLHEQADRHDWKH